MYSKLNNHRVCVFIINNSDVKSFNTSVYVRACHNSVVIVSLSTFLAVISLTVDT